MAIYCTPGEVSAFLQVGGFSDSPATTPTPAQVVTFIERAEQFIDEYTSHAYHSSRYRTSTKEPLNIQYLRNVNGSRARAQSNNWPIASLTNLYVWDGSTYVDYVASKTAGTFTDPLSGDYWSDTVNGYIYLKSYAFGLQSSSAPTGTQVYATYTYGEASTPADITQAAILLTATTIISNEEYGLNVPEGPSGMDNSTKATQFREQAMEILNSPHRLGRKVTIARYEGGAAPWPSLLTP